MKRSLARENDTAVLLAAQGYRVHQNPSPQQVAAARTRTGDLGSSYSKPDYLLEGRVFDCYSPGVGTSIRSIASVVEKKVVVQEQTQRVVINLADWQGDLDGLRVQFSSWPIAGLKEVKAVTREGLVVDVWNS